MLSRGNKTKRNGAIRLAVYDQSSRIEGFVRRSESATAIEAGVRHRSVDSTILAVRRTKTSKACQGWFRLFKYFQLDYCILLYLPFLHCNKYTYTINRVYELINI